MIPLLRLMGELLCNDNNRVRFDNTSPNGILLFREASRLAVVLTSRMLAEALPLVRPRTAVETRGWWSVRINAHVSCFDRASQVLDGAGQRNKLVQLTLQVRAGNGVSPGRAVLLTLPCVDCTTAADGCVSDRGAVCKFWSLPVIRRHGTRLLAALLPSWTPLLFTVVLLCRPPQALSDVLAATLQLIVNVPFDDVLVWKRLLGRAHLVWGSTSAGSVGHV